MKCKITTTFKDKYTQQIYKKDEIVDFKKERIDEILKVDKFIEILENKSVKSTKKNTKK